MIPRVTLCLRFSSRQQHILSKESNVCFNESNLRRVPRFNDFLGTAPESRSLNVISLTLTLI